VANDLASFGWLDRRSVEVIYNPAARGYGELVNDDPNPWGALQGKRILSVGALREGKDHALLVRAFARVRKNVEATLVILGEGSERQNLTRLIEEMGLTESVRLPGFVLDPYPWYREADLFVLASRSEGFGNVLVEAMECGLPVVSTDCPAGPREILRDGRYGMLVPVGNVEAMANGIQEALNGAPAPTQQKERAAEFSTRRASNAYLQLLI
jgi:glycosyltransferase involved in cell wall biosynthesis